MHYAGPVDSQIRLDDSLGFFGEAGMQDQIVGRLGGSSPATRYRLNKKRHVGFGRATGGGLLMVSKKTSHRHLT